MPIGASFQCRLMPWEAALMCGIFGILVGEDADVSLNLIKSLTDRLFKLSESRGKEASGIAVRTHKAIYVLKEPIAASKLIKSKEYKDLFNKKLKYDIFRNIKILNSFCILGHSRLVTNGQSELNSNNQPVIKDGSVCIHNGIVVNDNNLWTSFPNLKRRLDVDTEILLSLLQMSRREGGSLIDAAQKTFNLIKGSASVAVLFDDCNSIMLATNTGSLYACRSLDGKIMVFASESFILKELIGHRSLKGIFNINNIFQIRAGRSYLIALPNLEENGFDLNGRIASEEECDAKIVPKVEILEIIPVCEISVSGNNGCYLLQEDVKQSMMRTWEHLYLSNVNLKRCSKCILPETTPYINFDDEGVCNYCRSYEDRKRQGYSPVKGEDALKDFISKYRSDNGNPDCIVGFSGGRDSAYGLDYIKNTLKLNPIAFTYDWGMVVDLARRNQARICGELGIEQILVSADIKKKRENIRKNLEAWLKRPELGMIPILMAGDKKFYYYFHKVREQTGLKLFIFCGGHEIEETRFKYGFCGVTHGVSNLHNRLTGISSNNKIKLLMYFAKNFLLNPAYFNSSILDTLDAYYCTYILHDDYLYLYHYLEWDEEKIVNTIREKFDWEIYPDTKATWRIDDGTVAFYNYIYMTMAGLTEFDDFRSFQIREGKITRERAMELVVEENKPRLSEIEWYAQAVGFDINKTINIINSAPRLYN